VMINQRDIKHRAPTIQSQVELQFPFIVPAGGNLTFQIEEANVKPEIDAGYEQQTLHKIWQDTTIYMTRADLLADLNMPNENNTLAPTILFADTMLGKPVGEEMHRPVAFLPFEMKRPIIEKRAYLYARAHRNIYWESRLRLLENDTTGIARKLGFAIPEGEHRLEAFVPVGGFSSIVAWTMWPGVGMMVMAGLLAFALQWKTIIRAFSGVFKSLGKDKPTMTSDPVEHIEIPMSWFMIGFVIFGIIAIIVMKWLFGIAIWMGIIAVIMSFFLAVVAVRAAGETGINPIGAMGKVTQLTYGALDPGNIKTNLMTACMTAGAATSSADMINMLKVGHIVGARARSQFFAQFIGILFAILVIPVFFILVPNPSAVGTTELPAPAAIVWAGVAKLLSQGIGMLPKSAVIALIIGCLCGILIVILERLYPKSRKFLPSATAMGIAMIVPALYGLSMFLGAMIALILSKAAPKTNETFTIPVASGFIAGESLTGVFFAVLAALGG